MSLVGYLSHPIGPADHFEQLTERHDNLDNAGSWLRFLIQRTRWAIMCPWLAYTVAGGAELYGPRALTDQIMLLERCDMLIQVGGELSPHMTIERNHARRAGLRIIDLTDLGRKPADPDRIATIIKTRTRQLELTTRKRRAWLPPLEEADVDALRAAQLKLQDDPNAADARAVIQRIITAAMQR